MLAAVAPVQSVRALPVPGTKIPTYQFDSNQAVARYVAQVVARVIRERNSVGQKAVLGLPTGSTPVGLYRELVRMHREEGLDFSGVVTFNLDEYFGLNPDQLQSYRRWMHDHFFRHVNVPEHQIHIPDGTIPLDRVDDFCRRYEDAIERAGGIDVQILGVGRNGHIGFNEPTSSLASRTRVKTLTDRTLEDNARFYAKGEQQPVLAVTMGIGTILDAREILLQAIGSKKAPAVRSMLEGPVSSFFPASALQQHRRVTAYVDQEAASQLTMTAYYRRTRALDEELRRSGRL
jgi:glucosamine-6-phosphate deaminase